MTDGHRHATAVGRQTAANAMTSRGMIYDRPLGDHACQCPVELLHVPPSHAHARRPKSRGLSAHALIGPSHAVSQHTAHGLASGARSVPTAKPKPQLPTPCPKPRRHIPAVQTPSCTFPNRRQAISRTGRCSTCAGSVGGMAPFGREPFGCGLCFGQHTRLCWQRW